jgi:hypothetical protein
MAGIFTRLSSLKAHMEREMERLTGKDLKISLAGAIKSRAAHKGNRGAFALLGKSRGG